MQPGGCVCRIYMFRTPFLMTTDVDILKEVFVKDFNNFISRVSIQRK